MRFVPDRGSPLPLLTALALVTASAWCLPRTAHATFHLNEISKVMTSFNGDATVQAVELKMLANGENHVTGVSFIVYDAAGNPGATLGTFAADLPVGNAVTGAHILLATMKWKQKFGVTPDLQINPGFLTTDGQILEQGTCVVNAVAYGAVTTFVGGNVSSAPPLPAQGAPVLVRVTDNAIFPSCPMDENAASKFQFVTASTANPVIFTNNSGVSASVSSTVTGVDETASLPFPPRAYPNPFRGSIRIESPSSGWIGVFDVRGSLVRVLRPESSAHAAPYRGDWDGRDRQGRAVPTGIYFIRFGRESGAPITRVALLR